MIVESSACQKKRRFRHGQFIEVKILNGLTLVTESVHLLIFTSAVSGR